MPATRQTTSQEHNQDDTSAWITLASMFVGQRLDRWGAIGAYVAAVVTLAVSVSILLHDFCNH
jgi:hypothetical protein